MKKSKVLVPALGVLCLGMAAAVTGTVAWFTQNTSVYAKEMKVSVTSTSDLSISVHGSEDRRVSLTDGTAGEDWITHDASAGLAAGIEGALNATTALHNTQNVSNAGKTVTTHNLAFIEPNGTTNTINPMTGVAATPIDPVGDNSAAYKASANYCSGSYDLYYQGVDATKDVSMTINVTKSDSANIDATLMFAIVIQDADGKDDKLYTYHPTGTSFSGPQISLEKEVAKQYTVYAWFDGTDENAKNANAVNRTITFKVDHAFVG